MWCEYPKSFLLSETLVSGLLVIAVIMELFAVQSLFFSWTLWHLIEKISCGCLLFRRPSKKGNKFLLGLSQRWVVKVVWVRILLAGWIWKRRVLRKRFPQMWVGSWWWLLLKHQRKFQRLLCCGLWLILFNLEIALSCWWLFLLIPQVTFTVLLCFSTIRILESFVKVLMNCCYIAFFFF